MSDTALENLQEKWTPAKIHDVILSLQPGFACGKRDDNGYVQLRMNNIGLKGRIITDSFLKVPKSETNLDKYILKNGDVIFNNTNSPELVGKTVLFKRELDNCVYSNHLTRIRINKDLIIPEFITHFLRFEQRKGTFQLLCRRFVGQAAVPRESLLNLDLLLPPLNEQKRIVSKIDELFKESKSARDALDEIPEIMKKFKQSVLEKAFKGKLIHQDPNDEPAEKLLDKIKKDRRKMWEQELKSKGKDPKKLKFKELEPVEIDDLSELPNGWIWIPLGQITDIMDVDHKMPKAVKEGIPFISPKDFKNNQDIDFENSKRISKEDFERMSKKCRAQEGDLLYSRIGTIGKVRIVPPKKFGISYSLSVIRPVSKLVDVMWLYYILQSDLIFQQAMGKRRSIGVPDLGLNDMKNFHVPLIPLNEQKKIVKIIQELLPYAAQIEKSVEEAKKRADRIDQTILAKAFRGELVSQDPNDEPASVLLERVKSEKEKTLEVKTVRKTKHKK